MLRLLLIYLGGACGLYSDITTDCYKSFELYGCMRHISRCRICLQLYTLCYTCVCARVCCGGYRGLGSNNNIDAVLTEASEVAFHSIKSVCGCPATKGPVFQSGAVCSLRMIRQREERWAEVRTREGNTQIGKWKTQPRGALNQCLSKQSLSVSLRRHLSLSRSTSAPLSRLAHSDLHSLIQPLVRFCSISYACSQLINSICSFFFFKSS